MKKLKLRHRLTLGRQAMLLICLCWIIPMSGIVVLINYYSNIVLRQQIESTTLQELKDAQSMVDNALRECVEASKEPTIDNGLYQVYMESDKSEYDVGLYQATMEYLSQHYKYDRNINVSMIAYNDRTSINYYMNSYQVKIDNSVNRDSATTILLWLEDKREELNTGTTFLVYDNNLYIARHIVGKEFEFYGTVVLKVNVDTVFQNMSAYSFVDSLELRLVENQLGQRGMNISIKESQEEPSGYMLKLDSEIDGNQFEYVIHVNEESVFEGLSELEYMMIFILLLALPFVALVMILFYRNFTRPIKQLVAGMEKVSMGEIGYQITDHQNGAEFIFLRKRFNEMSLEMREQFERQYEEQTSLHDAQIRALQSQINPHFLNNTLEVINWEIRLGENDKASKMLESFSTMLSASMSRSGNSIISLKQELTYMDAYLFIVSERMGSKLVIEKNIEDSLMECQVPRLILQPIVENAVEHGISYRGKGKVTISIYEEGKKLFIEVRNDNALDKDSEKRIRELLECRTAQEASKLGYKSIGLRNINQRLSLLYSYDYEFTVKSEGEQGTIAKIVLPNKALLDKKDYK